MNQLATALLKFSNLLEIANLCVEDGKIYEKQKQLIEVCRSMDQPFLAMMHERHQYSCDHCKVKKGEVYLYFENPAAPHNNPPIRGIYGEPKGLWFAIDESKLHQILAHGGEVPNELETLLASIGG